MIDRRVTARQIALAAGLVLALAAIGAVTFGLNLATAQTIDTCNTLDHDLSGC